MELDWSTFILEIVNFLILVWLLAHFFYKPVMNIIAERKKSIQDTLDKAEHMRTDAESLKSQYENRLEDWEKEKAVARGDLHVQLEQERKRAMEELEKSMEEERERAGVLAQRERDNALEEAERAGVAHGLSFSTRLLERLAGPEIEARLARIVGEDLLSLSTEQASILRRAWSSSNGTIVVRSVWPVEAASKTAIQDALSKVTGATPGFDFKQDPSLIAGICIDIGSFKIEANFKSELRFFAEMHRDLDGK